MLLKKVCTVCVIFMNFDENLGNLDQIVKNIDLNVYTRNASMLMKYMYSKRQNILIKVQQVNLLRFIYPYICSIH